jgi:hypothetical protein
MRGDRNMFKRVLPSIIIIMLSMIFIAPSIASQQGQSGAVYVMTNADDDNEIVVLDRDAKGTLTEVDLISTGGLGSGGGLDPLGSQGSLILSPNRRWLVAVNAGSDNISVFRIRQDDLELIDQFDSGGEFPVSITLYHDLLYVLNAGGVPNITGFRLTHRGVLEPLDDSTRDLPAGGGFHQVGFDPQGDVLVVTQGNPPVNNIHIFPLNREGLPSLAPVTSDSVGVVPFGFIFDRRGHLLVSEAGSGAVTSYKILSDYSPGLRLTAGDSFIPRIPQATPFQHISSNPARGVFCFSKKRRDSAMHLLI